MHPKARWKGAAHRLEVPKAFEHLSKHAIVKKVGDDRLEDEARMGRSDFEV